MRRIRKAILTGGGRATRLRPITSTINKHLVLLANKPMIFHAIEKVVDVGVEEIFINLNPGETSLPEMIGDGGHWGVKITYFEQTGGPQGIAHVVKEAQRFIGDDPFIFYLSDNIILGGLHEFVREYEQHNYDCVLALSKVPDGRSFGVPVFNNEGVLTDVLEKPSEPPSPFAVTGIYLYGPKVFFDAYNKIEKSARGEYEISSIHSVFLKEGIRVGHREITGSWKDTGKPDDLIAANGLILDQMSAESFSHETTPPADARVQGNVHIGAGCTIGKNVTIIGPAMIAEQCTLENCTILPHTTLGLGATVRNATVGNSIILNYAYIEGDFTIDHSIIGQRASVKPRKEATRLLLGDFTSIEL